MLICFSFCFSLEWHCETYGQPLDFSAVEPEDLALRLRKFYCEATPKQTDARKRAVGDAQATEYHRNSLLNIRAAINRHIKDLKRDVDIVRDKPFKRANNTLDGFLKHKTATGLSAPVKHKEILSEADLVKIASHLENYDCSAQILRDCAWYVIAIHFVTRGLEAHHQLRRDSLSFRHDESGQYVTLSHDLQQKNHQGGIEKSEHKGEKRVYATGTKLCPVKVLKLFLEKTDPEAEMLFNQMNEQAISNPDIEIWYTTKQLSKRTFCNFMPNISKAANLSTRYTAHCLRATAIEMLNDEGFQARHIMFMSNHRNEASLRSYSRGCSNGQKKQMSSALSRLVGGHKACATPPPPPSTSMEIALPSSSSPENVRIPLSQMVQNNKQNISEMEFFNGAIITNCTFNISK